MAAAPASTGVAVPSPTPADIRDIRGPISIPSSWLVPLVVLGALLLLAAVALLVRRWWRRRGAVTPPPPPPDVVALARLEAARALLDPAHAREFCFAVSETVREYIEARFAVLAARRTTEEFLHELVRAPAGELARHAASLEGFLRASDLVKFARARLAKDEMEEMHASACRFVRDTRPGTDGGA